MSDETVNIMKKCIEDAEELAERFTWLTPEMTKDIAITMFIHEVKKRGWYANQ